MALPNDVNPLGNLLGGKVMHLVDLAGAIAAIRHARTAVVTASVDHMSFIHPVHIGQLIRLKASVNRVFRTSMEVGVKVLVEDLITGELKHTSSAYLTFVALDKAGTPRCRFRRSFPRPKMRNAALQLPGQRREYRLALRPRNW